MYEPILANLTVTARFLRDLILVVLCGSKKFFTLNYSLLSGLVRTARYLIKLNGMLCFYRSIKVKRHAFFFAAELIQMISKID